VSSPGTGPIPFAELDVVFLDVGNTLITMDFEWLRDELAALGLETRTEAIARAEARARPVLSQRLAAGLSSEADDSFLLYVRLVLERLERSPGSADVELERVASAVAPRVRARGTTRLWSQLLPGVPDALRALREAGLELIAVSNSDGSVEAGLAEQGLRELLDGVVDSHVVGFEKPDPRIFEHALELARAPRERILHVGDLYATDVLGARAAGLHALLLDPFDDWRDVDCERLADLPALANRLLTARHSR
jgi:HAD superfamily hydrolase (TIGR01509 family)